MLTLFRLVFVVLVTVGIGACGFHFDKSVEELAPTYANAHSRFVAVDGMQVHYRDQGLGPPLLLLHGSNASLHIWEGWVKALSGEFRLISLDLPGHGLTGPHPENRYAWKEMAQFLDRFTQELGLERFSIVGNSMGGGVAWNYTLGYPQKVDKLILVASRGIPPEEDLPFAFKAYSIPVLNRVLTVFSPRWLVGSSLREVYGDPGKVTDEAIDRYFELNLRAGNREATRYRMTHLDTYENLPRLATITAPTLILWGQRDRWILPKYAAQFATRLPQAEVILYPELGHVPMEEAPERTALDTRNFLRRGTVGASPSPERDRPTTSPPS